jgi:hypothetical protein
VASGVYQSAKKNMFDGALTGGLIDLDTNTINAMLASADQAGNLNSHDYRDDFVQEVSGTNYSSPGVALASKTVTASSGTITFDAADVTYTNVTIAAIRGVVLAKIAGGASSADPLLSWHDVGAQAVTAANFVVQWNASGIITLA